MRRVRELEREYAAAATSADRLALASEIMGVYARRSVVAAIAAVVLAFVAVVLAVIS